ncbi:MAG: hypothetical protein QW613_08020, partial [Thermoprotei archaeon]
HPPPDFRLGFPHNFLQPIPIPNLTPETCMKTTRLPHTPLAKLPKPPGFGDHNNYEMLFG